ncbi:hypothetical protein ZIOFF_065718 [Zingiber officinale]|uniref:Uncharacterized protein n=1 Tax=Zingiber officinale TaxID=94328 RepID=A0A8J5KBM6_ZINOF|nr:hypothetical protein ZIOFF_065718 [Zingiber officinale]
MGFNVELASLASKVRGDVRLCCCVIFDGVYENLLFFPVIQLIKDRYFSSPEQQNTVSSDLGTNSNTANFKKHVDNKDLILSSPKPVAEANQQAFRASNGVSIILPFLISDHHRAGVLRLLSCLIIKDVLQVHPEELGALIEILKSDMITSVSGSQYKLQNDAKCDMLGSLWCILGANNAAQQVFGDATGFSLLLTTLHNFQSSELPDDALLSCLRQSAHFFPLGLPCISKSASAATTPCSSTIIFLKSWTAERLNNVAAAFSLASRAGIVPPSAMKDLFSFPVFAINRSSRAVIAFTSCEPADNCSTSINTVIRLALIAVIRLAANDVGSLNKASMFEVLIELLLFWKTNGLLPFFIVLVGLVDAGCCVVLHNITVAEYFHWNMLLYYVNYALGISGHGNLAGIYYEQSQLDMAILHYKQAINCDSTFIEAYNNLTAADGLVNRGNTFKKIGRVTEAIQDYIRAVNI